MLTLIFIIFISFTLTILLTRIILVIRKKKKKEREKIITFECGFNSFKKARAPFSLKFFLFTIIFLIFDIEVALLLPLGFINVVYTPIFKTFYAFIVIFILILGLVHEWNQGILNWIL